MSKPRRKIDAALKAKTAIRADPGTVELEFDPAVEGNPKRLVRFTRRVRHSGPTPLPLSR